MNRERTTSCSLRAVAGLALTLAWSPECLAQTLVQDEGPLIVDESRSRLEGYVTKNLDASLQLLGSYSSSTNDPAQGEEVSVRNSLLREELELSTESYIGHERLIDLSANVRFRLEQEYIDSDILGESEDQNYFTGLFDINALLFKESNLPWTVFAMRDQTQFNQQFSGTFTSTVMRYGTSLGFRSDRSTSTIRYSHTDTDQDGPLNTSDYTLTRDTVNAQSQITLSASQRLSLSYDFNNIDQSSGATFRPSETRHEFNANHRYEFGGDQQHQLESRISYYDSVTGGRRIDRLRWSEIMRLRHSRTLNSNLDWTYESRNQSGVDQTNWRGAGQLRHRLFESLNTTATAGAARSELDGRLDTESIFADVFFDYRKIVPYGRLNGSLNLGVIDQTNGERGQAISVDMEPHVFSDPFPIILNRRNIDANSIVVYDAAGIRIFIRGVDYTERLFSDRAEITRVVGGAIADGDTVLIDYVIGPEPGSDLLTTNVSVGASYTINQGALFGLGVFGNLNVIDQDIEAIDPTITAQDMTRLEYGVDYRNYGLYLSAKRTHQWSTISPFVSTLVLAEYAHTFGRRSTLSLESSFSDVKFTDENNRIQLMRLRGSWNQRFTQNLDMNLRLTYRDETSDLSGDTEGFEQRFEIRWRKNQTSVSLTGTNSFLNSAASDSTFQSVLLSIRRSF